VPDFLAYSRESYDTPTLRALAAGIRANVPTIIWGPPGRAKTALICALGEANGMHVETVSGALREPSDFLGIPVESNGEVYYSPPAWARRLAQAEKGLLFLDELSVVSSVVQKAMLRILQERYVGEFRLPQTVAMVAAANPPTPANGADYLPPALSNRFLHLQWEPPYNLWLRGLKHNFDLSKVGHFTLDNLLPRLSDDEHSIRYFKLASSIEAFLLHRFNLLDTSEPPTPVESGYGWPTMRSWHNMVSILSYLSDNDDDAALLVAKGCVGDRAAIEYFEWVSANDLYDPIEAMKDPSTVDWSSRPDRVFALLQTVAGLGSSDPNLWHDAIGLTVACAKAGKPDLAVPAATELVFNRPPREKLPANFVKVFSDLLIRIGVVEK